MSYRLLLKVAQASGGVNLGSLGFQLFYLSQAAR